MAKPSAFFPNTALPNLQEVGQVLDIDPLNITGSITQKSDVALSGGYASSGAIAITVTAAFGTWPAYGVIENLTTLEQMIYSRSNADTLNVASGGRARNGTVAAAGSGGQNIRFIELRGLGRFHAQMMAEMVAHDDFLRTTLCRNEIVNGNMAVAQLGTSALSTGTPAITAAQSIRIDRMFCRPAGAAVTVQQSTTVPDNDSEFSAQINGAASVTTVNFGQRVEASRAKRLRRTVTFSAMIHNVSGAGFTPKIQVYTPTNPNNFAAVNSIQLDQNLQLCADNAWTKVSYTFDASTFTGVANGMEVSIQIPSGSCVAGDTIRVTRLQLERGSAATAFSDAGDVEIFRCWRFRSPIGRAYQGDKWATNRIMFQCNPVVPMIKVPSFNAGPAGGASWIANSPGSTQVSFYSWSDGGYVTITGAFTLQIYSGGIDFAILELNAATSFSGTVGATGVVQIGTGLTYYFDAEI